MTELDKAVNKLRNLKQYKDLSQTELELLAKEQIQKNEIIGSLTFCIDEVEKKFAEALLGKYLTESSIESNSDKDTLIQLIDMEVLVDRIKSYLKKEYSKSNPAIPTQMMEELRKTNEQVLMFKEKLGLTTEDKQKDSGLELFEQLKKKALKYYQEHAGCNTIRCPECNKLFYIMMRTKDLEPAKATFFRKTMLYNEKLYQLYHLKRISKEELAIIFGVSDYFIELMYQNIYLKELEEKNKC